MLSQSFKSSENKIWSPTSRYKPNPNQIFLVKTTPYRDAVKNWSSDYESDPLKSNKATHSGVRKVIKAVEGYMRHSTLHGLKYVGDTTISYGERFFWLVAFILAVFGAIYFIISIYSKYNVNPVIVTMNAHPTPVQQIPFPAITICNMNAAKKSEVKKILENGTAAELNFLSDLCTFSDTLTTVNVLDNSTGSWKNVMQFLQKVGQPCEQMLRTCKWHLGNIECNKIFTPILTDQGLCCNFNQLPLEYILRNPGYRNAINVSTTSQKSKIDDWNPERGYAPDSPQDVFPFRAPGPGAHLGLALVLDADIDNYYCTSSSSAGFKVLLHNPVEIPNMSDFAFMLPPGNEVRVVFKPVINDATLSLRDMDASKRHCYFMDERHLKYYRTYTKVNCKMECLTNVTIERCGCVPYYLPNSATTSVCSKMQEECSDNVREMMELQQIVTEEEEKCDCLRSCFELDYEKSMSYGKIMNNFQIRKDIIGNASLDYFQKNMLVLHIYFVNTQFSKFTKSELYGFSEFLSNTGGILGLFLGFSALSLVELVYYVTLRTLCSSIRDQKVKKDNKNIFVVK